MVLERRGRRGEFLFFSILSLACSNHYYCIILLVTRLYTGVRSSDRFFHSLYWAHGIEKAGRRVRIAYSSIESSDILRNISTPRQSWHKSLPYHLSVYFLFPWSLVPFYFNGRKYHKSEKP